MNTLLFLLLLSAAWATANGEEITEKGSRNNTKTDDEDPLDKLTEDLSSHITAPTLGSLAVVFLVGLLIYYLCCHKKVPEEGFTQLENEGGPPRNKRWRWKNRRFPRRNQRRNNQPYPPDVPHPAHVVIQNVVSVEIPTDNPNAVSATVTSTMPPAPPPYDGGMNNHRYFTGGDGRQQTTYPSRDFTKY